MTTDDEETSAELVDLVGYLGRALVDHPGGLIVGDTTTGDIIKHIPPTDYEIAIDVAVAERSDAPVRLRYKVAGTGIVADVRETSIGMLWSSVFEVIDTRTIHPVERQVVERIVRDRRRHDRVDPDTGMPRSLRAVVELVDHPDCTATDLEYGRADGTVGSIPVEWVRSEIRALGTRTRATINL